MKLAILSISSHQDRVLGWQQAIRDTWMKEWGHLIDVRFLMGRGDTEWMKDELRFNVSDSYEAMVFKTHAGFNWAVNNSYDYVFVACADTYIAVPRLLQSGFEGKDYVGCACPDGHLSGGAGYWLSRSALRYLVRCLPDYDYEDSWTGKRLFSSDYKATHDPRYHAPSYEGPPFNGDWSGGKITVHLSRGTGVYEPQWMIDCHKGFLNVSVDDPSL